MDPNRREKSALEWKSLDLMFREEDTGVVTFNLCGKGGDELVNKSVCASY